MRRPERERVTAVGLGAVLLALLAAGPAPAQPAVTLRFTGGELGFGVQGSLNGFPGNRQSAEARYREAADVARTSGASARLKEVLREWAALRAGAGDHRGAYELTNEALAVN